MMPMRGMPTAVTTSVEGAPKTTWLQKVRSCALRDTRRACSHTMRFAADPSSDRLPATVLTHANNSHDRVTAADEIVAADAATSSPISSTADTHSRVSSVYVEHIFNRSCHENDTNGTNCLINFGDRKSVV